MASCQSYRAEPLAPERHRAEWGARKLSELPSEGFDAGFGGPVGATGGALELSDGLSLVEAQRVAVQLHSDVRRARARAGVAEAVVETAGLWRDPNLSLSLLRFLESSPDPWLGGAALGLPLPLSGEHGARRELAVARSAVARVQVLEAAWVVWNDVRRAWIAWAAEDLAVGELERYAAELADRARVAAQLVELGELPPAESGLFELELARVRATALRRGGERAALLRALSAAIGLAPETPIEPRAELPLGERTGQVKRAELGARNLQLVRLERAYDAAESALELEVRRQYPDLNWGPSFEDEEGNPRLGLALSLPLPLWNRNRQGIARALAQRELARVEHERAFELAAGRLAAEQERVRGRAAELAALDGLALPSAARQVERGRDLLRLGEGTGLVLLESVRQSHELRLARIAALEALARARTRVEELVGPPEINAAFDPLDSPEALDRPARTTD